MVYEMGQVTNAEVDDGNVFDNIYVIQETNNHLMHLLDTSEYSFVI